MPITTKKRFIIGIGAVEFECSGPNGTPLAPFADRTKDCICEPRDPRAYADDNGAAFECPHHGFVALTGKE